MSVALFLLLLLLGHQIDLLDVCLEDLHRFLAMLYTGRLDCCCDHREPILALAHLFGVPAIAKELERQKHEPRAQCRELDIPCSFSECRVSVCRTHFLAFFLSFRHFICLCALGFAQDLLSRLWHSDGVDNADFEIEGKSTCVSRVVLSAHSLVFRKMFTSGMGESKSRKINISDISYG